METWKNVGFISGTKTLSGGLVVQCTAGLSFCLEPGMVVHFVPPLLDAPRSARIQDIPSSDVFGGVIYCEGIDNADLAQRYVGCSLLVASADLPAAPVAENDVLVGFTLADVRQGVVGTVAQVHEYPAQILLEVSLVDDPQKTILVPFVDELIVKISERKRSITMDLPNGLRDL